jgi:hypothetical protein
VKDSVDSAGGRGATILAALAVLAAASIVVGLVRSSHTWAVAESLPGQQKKLEELAEKLAEYKRLRKYDLKPKEQSRYVRRLMYDIARRLNMQEALRSTRDIEIERVQSKGYVRTKYAVILKDLRLDKVTKFLYEMQFSGRNLTPMEANLKRGKVSGMWNGSLGIHGVSKLK